ncbi:MAG: hypothetical protein VW338_00080 [Rhodospirillaceae bacterium]
MIEAVALTLVAGAWRYFDGRGIPRSTAARNVLGAALALVCAYVGMGMTWQAGVSAAIAITSLIVGYTDWRAWWSIARYGAATVAISVFVGITLGASVAVVLYGIGGCLVGALYVALHRVVRDFGFNTAVCETVAGLVVIGGLAWL